MKPINMSATLFQLIQEGIGFRNDDWSAYKTFILNDVLYGEICCLRNSDTVHFCNHHYKTNFYIGQDRIEESMSEEEKIEIMQACFDDNAPEFVFEIEEFLQRHFGVNKLYALWLTDERSVRIRYDGDDNNITAYRIPSDSLVISDLEGDGAFFVTTIDPNLLRIKKSI